MSRVFTTLFLVAVGALLCAQEAQLEVELSKDKVKVGEAFDLKIKLINAQGDIAPPDLSAFDVISGPNYSSSFSMINGQTEMSSSYSYRLVANEEGSFTIDPATVMVDGVEMATQPIKVEVEYDPSYIPSEQGSPIRRGTIKKKKGIRL
jgi:hypothetical protein